MRACHAQAADSLLEMVDESIVFRCYLTEYVRLRFRLRSQEYHQLREVKLLLNLSQINGQGCELLGLFRGRMLLDHGLHQLLVERINVRRELVLVVIYGLL